MIRLFTIILTLTLTLCVPQAQAALETSADVVVYGATGAGVIAAIAAAEDGKRVILYEPKLQLGGMVTGGLGRTDHANKKVIGGMSRKFYQKLGKHYGVEEGGETIAWYPEPHVATKIYEDWLKEAGVEVIRGSGYFLSKIWMEGNHIKGIGFDKGWNIFGDIFIDASYEGDLMARANVAYTWGREGSDIYGESLAGRMHFSPKHQFLTEVGPVDGDGEISALIQGEDPAPVGAGDRKVQAYNFRLCMTNVKDNLVPWPKPEGYDPADWDLLARYLDAVPDLPMGKLMNPVMVIPNGKTDTNNNGAISTDYIGESWDYPEASYEERAAIWEKHKRYNQGFLFFLANDPRVPEKLRDEMNEWGLAKDEFVDTDNWPHQLYVREARRMVGAYVMHQADLQTDRSKDDSIGMGSYNSDSHNVQRIIATEPGPWGDKVPLVINEGDMQVSVKPYEISYRALTPMKKEAENLLVVSCVSASHVAYSSIRMEPQYMIMGHAAGLAASQAIDNNSAVQDIDIKALQAKLREQGAILKYDDITAPFAHKKNLPGIVLDEEDAEFIGKWRNSTSVSPFVGLYYAHEVEAGSGDTKAIYTPRTPKSGTYEVLVNYTAHPNRCHEAKYTIRHADGVAEVILDQRKAPKGESPFVSLGTYNFNRGKKGAVEIEGKPGGTGYLVADAVQWLEVKE